MSPIGDGGPARIYPALLPSPFSYIVGLEVCEECAAAVLDKDKHRRWHEDHAT